jgi:glycosyltransferase involved in cell wall biosynthesis/peptidoglycan/xylan/chitin deacetylase (PgdA/CDA1 family)
MVIGYLINVYPKPSHSFIRREIAAIEALGHAVRRFSIRNGGDVIDAADAAERARTAVLLDAAPWRFALSVFAALLARPADFLGAVRLALRIGRRSVQGPLRTFAYLVEACLLLQWCRRDRVEHVHAHFGSNPAAVAMLCRALGGPSYSFTAHGIETFDAPEFQSLGEKIARAAFAVAVSEFGRSQLCRWSAPALWPRIHVIRCGVDGELLRQPPTPVPEAARLVCVARLAPEKGHIPLLHAVSRLDRAGRVFEVVLVGDGPMREELEALSRELGIERRVRFLGWRDGAGVFDEIRAARALLVPSFSEGLPVVLMEAMALGRPCIATQITGIPELVTPGVTGWLVPASSDEALAAAMAEAFDRPPAELERMGRAGAARVAALHDASAEAARLAAHFAEAARPAASSATALAPTGIRTLAPQDETRAVGAMGTSLRWVASQVWTASGQAARNRAALYGGGFGLRIAVFHGTPRRTLETLKRTVEWWGERWPLASPADADAVVAGRWEGGADRLLVTFDDGLASNYEAAVWLARAGVRATFFVIPSFVDRTVAEFVRYHDERGVRAFPPVPDGDLRALSTSQVRELASMGHRIAAHNDAHRDLGALHDQGDLRREIGGALDGIAELTGAVCRDFAVGFGQPGNVSPEAVAHLLDSCPNVYMCYRGLNVPGRTPLFLLRHAHDPGHPAAFTRLCLQGGADHWLIERVRDMEARVGLLPPAREIAA